MVVTYCHFALLWYTSKNHLKNNGVINRTKEDDLAHFHDKIGTTCPIDREGSNSKTR